MRTLIAFALASFFAQSQPAPLRVVVIQGEDAVNIIQQKTAVRPLVEIRDRNNVPVSGASVTFTVGTGQPAAFAGGAQTVTVTTNAAGQAAATGFTPTGAGAVQIQVQAAHQGQIASAMISQTNFATAAAAAAAGVAATAASGGAATAGAGAATTAGAAGGAAAGGGISATTIAIVGGAVAAGGAVVATKVAGGGEGATSYRGDLPATAMTATLTLNSVTGGTCVQQRSVSGTLELVYDPDRPKAMFSVSAPTVSETSIAGGPTSVCPAGGLSPGAGSNETPLSGVPNTPSFKATNTTSGGGSGVFTVEFTGTLNGDVITGTLTYSESHSGTYSGGGTVSIPVTLR